MSYTYPYCFKNISEDIQINTKDLDDLYEKLKKTFNPDILKYIFSAMLLIPENLDPKNVIPDPLEKML